MSLRVVFDTNVVVSALLFEHGRLAWMREVWWERGCVALISAATAAELLTVLAYPKFGLTEEDREELLGEYLPFCEVVEVPVSGSPTVEAEDADDQPFVDLAVAGGADLLVTGDAGLRRSCTGGPFEALAPGELAARLGLG